MTVDRLLGCDAVQSGRNLRTRFRLQSIMPQCHLPSLRVWNLKRICIQTADLKLHAVSFPKLSGYQPHYMVACPRRRCTPNLHKILKKSMHSIKIIGVRKVIRSRFHTEGPKMLDATLQNLVALATWRPVYANPCCTFLSCSLAFGGIFYTRDPTHCNDMAAQTH
jgi:hypothetical protein